MKKIFLGALLLMGIVFTAFSMIQKDEKPAKALQPLYWYYINTGNTIGETLNEGELSLKSEVLTESGCPDDGSIDCARGYSTQQVFGNSAPSVSTDDERIRKNQ